MQHLTKLDLESFQSALSASRLCQPTDWSTDVDELATLYDDELNHILDRLIPVRRLDRRQRHSDPWFDNECRAAKRLTRQYERTYAAASRRTASSTTVSPTAAAAACTAAAAKAAWYNQRRLYRQLRRRKCSEFWQRKLQASKADPPGLWKTADALLGRSRTPASSAIDVEVFNQFFAKKIVKVRSNTGDASPPMYSRARPGVSLRRL